MSTRQEVARDRLVSLAGDWRDRADGLRAGRSRFRRIGSRHEELTAPVAVSSWQLFPTPADVAARMMRAAGFPDALAPGLRVLEPSAGNGNLVRALLGQDVAPDEVTACEIAPDVAREFARDFPAVRLHVGDFLAQTADSLGGLFDRIVMNPPFHRGADVRHVLHAAHMLAPGGVLVGLCYDGAAFRDRLRARCTAWEALPRGSFREAGTGAAVVMVTLKAGALDGTPQTEGRDE